MKRLNFILLILTVAFFSSCEESWETHYNNPPETIDESVWDALKSNADASEFVALAEKFQIDSLFKEEYNDVYTLFVPGNEAVSQYLQNGELDSAAVAYHILRYFIHPSNITGTRKVQTLLLKFAQFENRDEQYLFDNIPVTYTSPLYVNGRFFIIEEVAEPKPSIYEYIAKNNTALKEYIDMQDSIVLDKELSKPLGFDDNGNTIYDSVITVINKFEEEYFEVSEEFRVKTATLVFPNQEMYEKGLTNMAIKLGGDYTNHEDIAVEWQQDVLIPYLLGKGVYNNLREPNEFRKDTMINILGDSVEIDFSPVNKVVCSNGYAYDYAEFEVLDTLFMSPIRNEGERYLKSLGKDRFTWHDSVTVISDQTFVPDGDYVVSASNDSILNVVFSDNYEGEFSAEFLTEPLFPRRYLFVVRTHMDYGGVYEIYVNDELVRTFDYYDFIRYRGVMPSSVDGKRFIAVGRYNKFDFWVDNITEYGKALIKFVYKGQGNTKNAALLLDYIDCVPEGMTHVITRNP